MHPKCPMHIALTGLIHWLLIKLSSKEACHSPCPPSGSWAHKILFRSGVLRKSFSKQLPNVFHNIGQLGEKWIAEVKMQRSNHSYPFYSWQNVCKEDKGIWEKFWISIFSRFDTNFDFPAQWIQNSFLALCSVKVLTDLQRREAGSAFRHCIPHWREAATLPH